MGTVFSSSRSSIPTTHHSVPHNDEIRQAALREEDAKATFEKCFLSFCYDVSPAMHSPDLEVIAVGSSGSSYDGTNLLRPPGRVLAPGSASALLAPGSASALVPPAQRYGGPGGSGSNSSLPSIAEDGLNKNYPGAAAAGAPAATRESLRDLMMQEDLFLTPTTVSSSGNSAAQQAWQVRQQELLEQLSARKPKTVQAKIGLFGHG
ncbi:unnamed protein product [Amoebophrya sp. A120]|nr:unnamed protein product [Amoebophrya sp. A120]|eukprot:GSA120T00000392001.1